MRLGKGILALLMAFAFAMLLAVPCAFADGQSGGGNTDSGLPGPSEQPQNSQHCQTVLNDDSEPIISKEPSQSGESPVPGACEGTATLRSDGETNGICAPSVAYGANEKGASSSKIGQTADDQLNNMILTSAPTPSADSSSDDSYNESTGAEDQAPVDRTRVAECTNGADDVDNDMLDSRPSLAAASLQAQTEDLNLNLGPGEAYTYVDAQNHIVNVHHSENISSADIEQSTDHVSITVPETASPGTRYVIEITFKDNTDITIIITVSAAPTTYTLALTAGEGGTVSPVGENPYAKGADVTIAAIPDGGYRFVSWIDVTGGVELGSQPTVTFPMPGNNVTATAQFEKLPAPTTYKITVSDDGKGTATASAPEASEGATISLTATPSEGFEFDKWMSDDVEVSNNSFKMPAKDVAVKATFKAKTKICTIAYGANGGTGNMAEQTFNAGTVVTLAANAFTRDNYTFTGWNTTKDGTGIPYTDKAIVKLEGDTTLYAQWVEKTVPNKAVPNSSENTVEEAAPAAKPQTKANDAVAPSSKLPAETVEAVAPAAKPSSNTGDTIIPVAAIAIIAVIAAGALLIARGMMK